MGFSDGSTPQTKTLVGTVGLDGKGQKQQQVGTPQSGGHQTLASVEDEALLAHNLYRARHHAPPLSIDPQLTITAQVCYSHLFWTKRL